jgi:outer membrane protein assembly factor BamD (BamD/ComL family)
LVDAARQALAEHHPEQALRLLDQHAAEFDTPRLAEEAAFLRVQALARLGQDAEAARAKERFRQRHPSSPLTESLNEELER